MAHRDVIVIGGSAGGLEAVMKIAAGLPEGLPAAIFLVLHMGANRPTFLPKILERSGPMRARLARNGETIELGHIYVPPPDRHLLIEDDRILLSRGPKENGFRPAVDTLFRSAASAGGPRVIGVVLSGGLDDGAYGLKAIHQNGGLTVVQDPEDALVDSMPKSALRAVPMAHIVPGAGIAELLAQLISLPFERGVDVMGEPIEPRGEKPEDSEEKDFAKGTRHGLESGMRGRLSYLTCPDCGGSLWEVEEEELLRFRCHVGHAYNGSSLLQRKEEATETTLWVALRALEETAAFRRRLAERSRKGRLEGIAHEYEQSATDAEDRAEKIRRVLLAEPEDT